MYTLLQVERQCGAGRGGGQQAQRHGAQRSRRREEQLEGRLLHALREALVHAFRQVSLRRSSHTRIDQISIDISL